MDKVRKIVSSRLKVSRKSKNRGVCRYCDDISLW